MHRFGRTAPFSESPVWELQRRYFAESGITAWRDDVVPQYVTSNAYIADAYAEIVLAFVDDRVARGAASEPVHVCELGAGSGRFAYHFLTRLTERCRRANRPVPVRYVLTDFADRNRAFWREHAAFAPFFRAGLLDVAPFDVMSSDRLALEVSGRTIGPGALREPLVVVANYVFDGVPQELFHLDGGTLARCEVALSTEAEPAGRDARDLLASVAYAFHRAPAAAAPFGDPVLDAICDHYRAALGDGYVFVPAAAIRSLRRLNALSRRGMLVLSADRGNHRLDSVARTTPPEPARHGSVSYGVNYHALAAACEQSSGLAMFPASPAHAIDVGALLFVEDAADHRATAAAFDARVRDFGPDDFASVVRGIQKHAATLTLHEILGYVRLSRHDAGVVGACLARLRELAPDLDRRGAGALADAFDRTWDGYFPLGERDDLAFAMAGVLFDLGEFARALVYLERSAAVYGEPPALRYNVALCRERLGDGGAALRRLHDALTDAGQ